MNIENFIDLMEEIEVLEFMYYIGEYRTTKVFKCKYDVVISKIKELNNNKYIIEDDGCDKDYVYIKISKKRTLHEVLEEEYGNLDEQVILSLEHEINEFYNIFVDDIEIDKKCDMAESISEKLYLVDAIGNHGPLFNNTIIEHYVVKIYKGEIKLL